MVIFVLALCNTFIADTRGRVLRTVGADVGDSVGGERVKVVNDVTDATDDECAAERGLVDDCSDVTKDPLSLASFAWAYSELYNVAGSLPPVETVTLQTTTAVESTESDRNAPSYRSKIPKSALVLAVPVVAPTKVTSLTLTPDMEFETAFRKSYFAVAEEKEVLFSPVNVFEAENVMATYALFGYVFVGLPVGWAALPIEGIDVDGTAVGGTVGVWVRMR